MISRKVLNTMVALALSIGLTPGCDQISGISGTGGRPATSNLAERGALRVAVRLSSERRAQYVTDDVDHVDVTIRSGTLSQSKTFTRTDLTSESGATFDGLVPGSWTLGTGAYNAASQSIGGSLPIVVSVIANQTATASLTIELSPVVTYPSPLPLPTDPPSSPTPSPTPALTLLIDILSSQNLTMPISGLVSTLAGNAAAGWQDGVGSTAQFQLPHGIAVDTAGTVYVADTYNHVIRKVTPSGVVTTFAGSGLAGSTDGTGRSASFDTPRSLAVDTTGNIYVAEGASRIRKITPSGVVSTIDAQGGVNSVAVDGAETLYYGTSTSIYKRTQSTDTILAGGAAGYADGPGSSARFSGVSGLAVDAEGNVYVADANNSYIRKVTPNGFVTTVAGGGASSSDSTGMDVHLSPYSVTVDGNGNLFVGEPYRVRMLTPSGAVVTLAGGDNSGHIDGSGSTARFNAANGIARDSAGRLYVADTYNNRVRLIR